MLFCLTTFPTIFSAIGATINATGSETIKPMKKDLAQIITKSRTNPIDINVMTRDMTNDIMNAIITPNIISEVFIYTGLFLKLINRLQLSLLPSKDEVDKHS